jgi:hypothetical protein
MGEERAIAEVLAGYEPARPTPGALDAMAATVDAIHVRELRRACGCPNCRLALEGARHA